MPKEKKKGEDQGAVSAFSRALVWLGWEVGVTLKFIRWSLSCPGAASAFNVSCSSGISRPPHSPWSDQSMSWHVSGMGWIWGWKWPVCTHNSVSHSWYVPVSVLCLQADFHTWLLAEGPQFFATCTSPCAAWVSFQHGSWLSLEWMIRKRARGSQEKALVFCVYDLISEVILSLLPCSIF